MKEASPSLSLSLCVDSWQISQSGVHLFFHCPRFKSKDPSSFLRAYASLHTHTHSRLAEKNAVLVFYFSSGAKFLFLLLLLRSQTTTEGPSINEAQFLHFFLSVSFAKKEEKMQDSTAKKSFLECLPLNIFFSFSLLLGSLVLGREMLSLGALLFPLSPSPLPPCPPSSSLFPLTRGGENFSSFLTHAKTLVFS